MDKKISSFSRKKNFRNFFFQNHLKLILIQLQVKLKQKKLHPKFSKKQCVKGSAITDQRF